MAGYNDTMLQGLQRLNAMEMNRRRLGETVQQHGIANRLAEDRYRQQVQQAQELARQRDFQRQMQLLNLQGTVSQRNLANAVTEERLRRERERMDQPRPGPVVSVLGPDNKEIQAWRDLRTGKWHNALTGEAFSPDVASQIRENKPLPAADRRALEEGAGAYQKYLSLVKGFKPEYAGYVVPLAGDVANVAKQYIPGLSSDQPNWWRDYQAFAKLPAIQQVGGKTLTPREMAEFSKGDINPGMKSEDVAKLMHQRLALIHRGLSRQMQGAGAKYSPREIEAATSGVPASKANIGNFTLDELALEGQKLANPMEELLGR